MPQPVYQHFDEASNGPEHDPGRSIIATAGKKRKRLSSSPFQRSSKENERPSFERVREPRLQKLESHGPVTLRPVQPVLKDRAAALEKARKALPIWTHASEIRQGLQDKDVMLIVGETGSGKSTQVPQMLVEESWCKTERVVVRFRDRKSSSVGQSNSQDGRRISSKGDDNIGSLKVGGCIAVTEPRKVAAISLAERVAKEMGTPLGSSSPASKVGFSVRFNQSVSPSTRIKFLTEGMLLQEMLRDPWLRGYSAVILDEVHERGLNVDLLLGFLRQIVTGEHEGRGGVHMKVVIMSATAEMESLKDFFEAGYEQRQSLDGENLYHHDDRNSTENSSVDDKSLTLQPAIDSEWSGILSSNSEDGQAYPTQGEEDGTASSATGMPLDRRKLDQAKQLNPPNGCADNSFPKSLQHHGIAARNATREAHRAPSYRVASCYVEGRQYPVSVHYTEKPVSNWLDAALRQIFQIHYKEPMPGDILVFLTGQETVESLEKLILEQERDMPLGVPRLLTLPLFAALPQDAQQAIFQLAPARTRKVILATNIAETSVTVPGVRFVVDCGKAKIKHFRTRIGLESLLVKPISKSAATQRLGRAGREGSGHCWRLYTEADYLALQDSNIPEILRCDLSQAILTMQARGILDIYSFPFLDRPKRDAYEKALTHLYQLGALDDLGVITETGIQMARLPLSASLARTLLAATEPGMDCISDVVDIIACLSVENIFLKTTSEDKKEEAETARRTLYRREGDHLTLLATVQGYLRENVDRKEWCRQHWVSHRAMRAVLVRLPRFPTSTSYPCGCRFTPAFKSPPTPSR